VNGALRAMVPVAVWLLVSAARAGAQQSPSATGGSATDSVRWTRVTYLSGRSVYVSSGRDDGLEEGTELVVVRRGTAIATFQATLLSSHRASGEIVRGGDSVAVMVGDSARFIVRFTPPRVAAEAGAGRPPTPDTLLSPSTPGPISSPAGRSLRA